MPDTNGTPPVMLREITIADFRGISELKLSFVGPNDQPARVSVLGGPNGCGKTTVLEACLLAAGCTDLVRGAQGQAAIRSGAKNFRITAEFQMDSNRETVERTAFDHKSKIGAPCAYFSSWRAPKLVGALSVTAGKVGKRLGPTEENRLWITKQYLVNAKAHLSMATSPPPWQPEYDVVLRSVHEIWGMFYPGHGGAFAVEAVGADPDQGFDVFLNAADGARVPLDSLSSGQLEIFVLAASALPHREQESILFIDEPELHLDPQWHRLMLRAILRLRPRCQVIVATHSPEIYDSVMSYERHFLVPDDDPRAKAWERAAEKAGGAPA